jgi:hypothetical protein
MPILDNWQIQLLTDDVLKAQGADPASIRQRRPALVASTEQAIVVGRSLLHPLVLYEKFPVKRFVHERLELVTDRNGNGIALLTGKLIAQHMRRVQTVIVMVCTIGSELDESVSSLFKVDPVMAVALDGVGSAAVEQLAIQACNYFEAEANDQELQTTLPLNPGMIGWSVEEGQPQIFTLLDSEGINVSLTESCMMIPNKSISMILGLGKEVSSTGTSCDYCSLNGVCKYQNHYVKQD